MSNQIVQKQFPYPVLYYPVRAYNPNPLVSNVRYLKSTCFPNNNVNPQNLQPIPISISTEYDIVMVNDISSAKASFQRAFPQRKIVDAYKVYQLRGYAPSVQGAAEILAKVRTFGGEAILVRYRDPVDNKVLEEYKKMDKVCNPGVNIYGINDDEILGGRRMTRSTRKHKNSKKSKKRRKSRSKKYIQ